VGLDYEAFDAAFFDDLAERYAGPLEAIVLREEPRRPGNLADLVSEAEAAPGDFVAQLAAGKALLAGRQAERAREFLERARALFPGYHDDDSPLWHLARIAAGAGDHAAARRHLGALTALDENHWEAHLALADAAEALDDPEGAAAALERALAIDPLEPGLHVRLAGLYARTGDPEGAVRERRAIVALDPVDRAEALYQLAVALRDAGRPGEAKREVMRSLEAAPRFQRAQELLLELHRAGRDAGAGAGGAQ
jgi:tetratricopeptide (TPR) repeat protein